MKCIYDRLNNFARWEVLSPRMLKIHVEKNIVPHHPEALLKYDMFRDYIDAPLICNKRGIHHRGARSPLEQLDLYDGEDHHSFHCGLSCAFDSESPKLSLTELFEAAIAFGWTGVYVDYDKGFVHKDFRSGPKWFAEKRDGMYRLLDVA